MSQIKLGLYLTSVICICRLLQLIPVTHSFVRLLVVWERNYDKRPWL